MDIQKFIVISNGYRILIISVNRNDADLTIDGNVEMAKFLNMGDFLKFERDRLQI